MEFAAENNISLVALTLGHWRLVLGIVFASIGLAGLTTMLMPKHYQSQMKFLVNNERADMVITPDKNNSTTSGSEVSETQVNSEIELLKSRDILAAVVRDAHLYEGHQKVDNATATPLNVERAILGLQKALSVSALRKSNIIDVRYEATDPEVAAKVLRDVADRYLNAHLAVHSPPGTLQFFTDQAARNRERLDSAEAALSKFHRQTQLFSLPQQQAAVINRLEAVEGQLANLDAESHDLQSRLGEDQKQMGSIPDRVVTQIRAIPSQGSAEQLRTMLTELRNKRLSLAVKFKPGDRLLVELDREIENTSNALAQAQSERAIEQTTDLNTQHESLKTDGLRAQVTLKGLEARRLELSATRAGYLRELDAMDQQSLTLSDLERTEKEAEDNYVLYSRRVEEARLANSLDREKFSNVALIERPEPSPIPASPSLKLNLAAGATLGLFLAIALAFMLESRQSGHIQFGTPVVETPFGDRVAHARASGD